MIELTGAKISLDKNAPKYNTIINFGLSFFNKTNEQIFNFLNLKNQVLVDGTFSINDTIYSTEEGNNLLAFKINSQVVSILCVFQFNEEFTFKSLRMFKKELVDLRELNIENDDGKKEKIDKIFEIINKYKPLYITLDKNDPTNAILVEHVESKLLETKENVQYICVLNKNKQGVDKENSDSDITENDNNLLDEDTNVFVETIYDEANDQGEIIGVNDSEVLEDDGSNSYVIDGEKYSLHEREFSTFSQPYKHQLTKEDKEGNTKDTILGKLVKIPFLDYAFRFMKSCNWYIPFLIVFNVLVGFSSSSAVYLMRHELVPHGIALMFLTLVGLLLDLYACASLYSGLLRRMDAKYKKVESVLIFELFTVIGILIGLLISFIIDLCGGFINLEEFEFVDYIGIFVCTILALVSVGIAPYTSVLYLKFRTKLFNRRNKKEEE